MTHEPKFGLKYLFQYLIKLLLSVQLLLLGTFALLYICFTFMSVLFYFPFLLFNPSTYKYLITVFTSNLVKSLVLNVF